MSQSSFQQFCRTLKHRLIGCQKQNPAKFCTMLLYGADC